jgi:hypothetical protein
MKILKAVAILVIGTSLGILLPLLLASLALPPDPNFVAVGSHAAPGDGYLVMGFIFVGLLISVPLSALMAWHVVFKKTRNQIS